MALGATGGFEDKPRPPHGRWTVTVRPLRQNVKDSAHAYVARNDYNLGGLRRGKLSHLWLESYDPERFMRSREYDPPETAPKLPVQICSAGSMSGLSTGARSSVAGGYRIADGAPAPYCSAGPSRDARKGGPDWAYPTDESRAFPGLNSWGNRSGASVRLVGTSAAAPQYARDIDIKGKAALPPPGEDPKNANPRLGFGRK